MTDDAPDTIRCPPSFVIETCEPLRASIHLVDYDHDHDVPHASSDQAESTRTWHPRSFAGDGPIVKLWPEFDEVDRAV